MNQHWKDVRTIGLAVILLVTIACLCLGALGMLASLAMNRGPEVMDHFETSHISKVTTWSPWTQATSCPWDPAPPDWRPARVRLGRVVEVSVEVTFWQVEGQPDRIYHHRGTPRWGAFLKAGAAAAGMGAFLLLFWYIMITFLGKDSTPVTNGLRSLSARTRMNSYLVILHCAAVVLGFLGIFVYWLMTFTKEWWSFTATHTGKLWCAGILANFLMGCWALFRKKQSIPLTAMSVLALLAILLSYLQGFGLVAL